MRGDALDEFVQRAEYYALRTFCWPSDLIE